MFVIYASFKAWDLGQSPSYLTLKEVLALLDIESHDKSIPFKITYYCSNDGTKPKFQKQT